MTTFLVVVGNAAVGAPGYTAGSDGLGDPYFPQDGNGGYDVAHYQLDVSYEPATHLLQGVATINASALQNLSRFNLDLDGLTVTGVRVQGQAARWHLVRGELVVTPAKGIAAGSPFTTVVEYGGVPQQVDYGPGPLPTDDGTLFLGEPHVASTWFPVNDHPTDKASFTVRTSVPAGVEAVGNGRLVSAVTAGGRTTWTWHAPEPMASYLATVSVGQFGLDSYKRDGISYVDAIDPDLFVADKPQPRTGTQFAYSQRVSDEQTAYKRLLRRIDVPASGGTLSFWVERQTEEEFDFFFVEAHTLGADDWTTLPDLNGHTSSATGWSCPWWQFSHPFLAHYQTDNGDGTCTSTGTTGQWWAASGFSDGYEQWQVDLSAYAGKSIEVSLSYASDDFFQLRGVAVDDVVVSTGQGTTSFEKGGGNVLSGWQVSGPPPGSPPNENNWVVTTTENVVLPVIGDSVKASLARQPEIIRFLSPFFGAYPFGSLGGVVDDLFDVGFALENQTRPVYSPVFWFGGQNDFVVVHELAHQWVGDSVAVGRWADIWLNEGFATYAEWLWAEHEFGYTPDQNFADFYSFTCDDFYTLPIGDPGPDHLFDGEVYARGAMTLQALRREVGDDAFFTILRRWTTENADGNVRTADFVALAEQVSGLDLGQLFHDWLLSGVRPVVEGLTPPDCSGEEELRMPNGLAKQQLHRFAAGRG